MKRFFYALVPLMGMLLLGSCSSKTYNVKAIFPDDSFNGKTALITASYNGSVLDSALIAEKTALFDGEIVEPVLALISCERTRGQLILEPGEITIDLQQPGSVSVASGTPLNKELGDLMEKYNQLMDEIMNYQGEDEDGFLHTVWTPKFTQEIGGIFKSNSNNDIGTMALMYLSKYGESDSLDAYFDQAGETVISREPIQKIIKQRQALKQTAEGMMFTDFTIEDSDGQSVSFSDYIGKGKYVLVDFWAGWCGPCKREIPHIREIYDKYNGADFMVLGVAVWEKPEETKKAIEELGIIWPSIINAQSIPTDIYGINGIPHIILFGPDGTIVARGLRGETMKAKVAEVLGK
ncbi:MAG: TlpA disulfide reductase family protein [Bacteroidales bacterium]|jgi:thiol-disulfide isomerase/thioredoxin|nr:AhpC/TSA family protein [Bacteroidales bacterium]MDD2264235.1 TlpA disulfide reductase family protein [Bacteroidales bacterium]MDD2831469.1 TlpA disulfide reductase family protein [Bacteroidales bacterium]MDD3208463.1 TlpA disulfide reductase family protein [Bacteroidales bacterium]MDD3697124.1 TlpA disulfide reductase family protein [Bacteroidales bacterium]